MTHLLPRSQAISAPFCPYCGELSKLVYGDVIYPHRPDLKGKAFYHCGPCRAYVGCHPGTTSPLGRLANAELRAAKSAAHAHFDPAWKSRRMSRADAYTRLADAMGIEASACHIGMFDVDQCRDVVSICKGWPK